MLTHYPKGPMFTERLTFRALRPEDFDHLYDQFSDSDMCRYYGDPPCSEAEIQDIIGHYTNEEEAKEMRWVMELTEDGTFIGTCGFHYFDKFNGRVEIGYDIWKSHWRKGYMKEALPLLLQICFKELQVSVVYGFTHPENTGSKELLLSAGFRQDGILRAWIKNAGKSQDQAAFSLLRQEWENNENKKQTCQ